MSLPLRERGLKLPNPEYINRKRRSLPLRERGLKSLLEYKELLAAKVAPLAGAWIEIPYLQ